jgi:glycosyltransferase involved in cell wall biosynthesis
MRSNGLNIGVNALLLRTEGSFRNAGISRYILRLLEAFDADPGGHRYQVWVPEETEIPPNLARSRHLSFHPTRFRNRLDRVLWDHFQPKRLVQEHDLDVFFATNQACPVGGSFPRVAMIHDLTPILFPQFFSRRKVAYQRMSLRYACRRCDIVLTSSHANAADIASQFGAAVRERTRVAQLAAGNRVEPPPSPEAAAATVRRLGVPFERFALSIGTIEPRKNLVALVEAMGLLRDREPLADFGIAIAGGKGWLDGPLYRRIEELGIQDRVAFLGYVQEEDLPALFAQCACFVFPSLYEGFGMPVLEAMEAGAPVLASEAPAVREVGGEAVVYFDPRRPEALADALERALSDAAALEDLRQRGFERAKAFTWARTARETIATLEEAVQLRREPTAK